MSTRKTLVTVLLVCGILSSIAYIAGDILAAMRWEAYRYADWSVSELIALDAPTRSFIVWPMTAYNALVLAFGIGVWLSAAKSQRAQRATGVLLFTYGIVSWLGLTVFALRPDGSTAPSETLSLVGVLHASATAAQVLLMLGFIAVGAAVLGKRFRWYSIATILVVLVGGVWAGSYVEQVSSGIHPAGLGLIERSCIYSMMLWVAVFAFALLQTQWRGRSPLHAPAAGAYPLASPTSPKRVVALVGSGHKRGATYTAARKLLENLESFGDVEGEIVMLSEYEIRTCHGCKACFTYGEDRCPLKDDRDVVLQKMLDADGVIFASPNYSWQVSGLMKVFLDRMGFVLHRPRFHGRSATAVVVQGIAFGGKVRKYLEFVAGGLGFKVVKGSVITTLEPMTDKALQQMDETLAEQSRRFHAELLRPAFPTPSLLALMAFRMGRTGFKLNLPREARDWTYYQEHGWFESDYYYPTRLGPFKKVAGAFFDWLVAKTGMFSVASEKASETPMAPGSATR